MSAPTQNSLSAVLSSEDFARRPVRSPDYLTLSKVLSDLAQELATSPNRVLQKIADAALSLCKAQSAGINLLEEKNGAEVFRLHAASGAWSPYLWSTLPRASPSGAVVDLDSAQLMLQPARHFPVLQEMSPEITEVLLVPFKVAGRTAGTVWVISHDGSRQFDLEDKRVVASLATFAARVYEHLERVRGHIVIHPVVLDGAPPVRAPATRKRLLVVAGETGFARAVTELLQGTEHEVSVAIDLGRAFELAAAMRPDIVFLDMEMLDGNGSALAKQLRKKAGAAVRLVVFSEYPFEADRTDSAAAGFDHYTKTPIDPAFLAKMVA